MQKNLKKRFKRLKQKKDNKPEYTDPTEEVKSEPVVDETTVKKVEPKKLTPIQVAVMKAKSLSKVKITNLDPQNTGSNSVMSCVCNMYMDIQRVIPLGIATSVEQCLIEEIEARKIIVGEPELDNQGNKTGNMVSVEAPMYAVSFLK